MTLDELIRELENTSPGLSPTWGFSNPHSYRGFYEDLAFEPTQGVTFGEMLETARSAKGQTFFGYKGGEYLMHGGVDTYIAHTGSTGEPIGPLLLAYMRESSVTTSPQSASVATAQIREVGNFVLGLSSMVQQDNASYCEICARKAVVFNPGNVVVQCNACGSQPPGDYEHLELRQRHLLDYVLGAAAQLPCDHSRGA